MRHRFLLACLCLSLGAVARTPEGPLGVLLTPNDARPAVLVPGASIELLAAKPGAIHLLSNDARIQLEVMWSERADKTVEGIAKLPREFAPGNYAIEWSDSGETDVTPRAVYVCESMPEAYTFALINAADENFEASLLSLAEAQHQFAIVVIDGTLEQLQRALQAVLTSDTPTYFYPTVHNADTQRWIGPHTHAFACGPDAFLFLQGGAYGLGDTIGNAPGEFAQLRRKHKRARWAVAVIPAADTIVSMRNTLTLFVDDPVHAVLAATPTAVPPSEIDWAGWYEPIPVFAPRDTRLLRFSATLGKVAPYVPKPAPVAQQ